jgi:hypothetical protein
MSDGTAKPATWPMWRGPLAYGQAAAIRIRFVTGRFGLDLRLDGRIRGGDRPRIRGDNDTSEGRPASFAAAPAEQETHGDRARRQEDGKGDAAEGQVLIAAGTARDALHGDCPGDAGRADARRLRAEVVR